MCAGQARFADPSPLLEQIRGLGGLHSSVNTGTCSVATGEGLQRAVVGGSAVFSVTTYDASGARRRTGGEEVVMACEEAGGFEYRVADGGDGTYEVRRIGFPRFCRRHAGGYGWVGDGGAWRCVGALRVSDVHSTPLTSSSL